MWLAVLLILFLPTLAFTQSTQLNCAPLDPRISITKETETKVKASVGTVYKIARAGGQVEQRAKEEIQSLSALTTGKEQLEFRWIYLFCEMLRTSKDMSDAEKFKAFDAVKRATYSGQSKPAVQPSKPKEQSKVVYRDSGNATKTPEPSKEFAETKAALENRNKELHLLQKDSQEKTEQLSTLEKKEKEKADEASAKKKLIQTFVGQLSMIEEQVTGNAVSNETLGVNINQYNQILRSLKKELPTDSYIEQASRLPDYHGYGWDTVLLPHVRDSISHLKFHLEQVYLK